MEFSFGYQRVFDWQSVHGEDNEEKEKEHTWHHYIWHGRHCRGAHPIRRDVPPRKGSGHSGGIGGRCFYILCPAVF